MEEEPQDEAQEADEQEPQNEGQEAEDRSRGRPARAARPS